MDAFGKEKQKNYIIKSPNKNSLENNSSQKKYEQNKSHQKARETLGQQKVETITEMNGEIYSKTDFKRPNKLTYA